MDIERGFASRSTVSAAQLPFERRQARVTRASLQQCRVRDDGVVRAGVTPRAHQVEGAQVVEPEIVARRHGRTCLICLFTVRTNNEHVNGQKSGPMASPMRSRSPIAASRRSRTYGRTGIPRLASGCARLRSSLTAMLAPYPSGEMICWPVSPRVGNVKWFGPSKAGPPKHRRAIISQPSSPGSRSPTSTPRLCSRVESAGPAPFPRSDRRASHTSPTGPKHQTAAAAADPPQALWKTRVLTSMLSRGSTLAGAVGSSKAECAVKRAVPSSAES